MHRYLGAATLTVVAAVVLRARIVACHGCLVYEACERGGALVYEGFEVDIVNGGEGLVEKFAGEGYDGDEVAVEKDGVEDGCGGGSDWLVVL